MTRSFALVPQEQHVWNVSYSDKAGRPLEVVAEASLDSDVLQLEVVSLRLLYAQQRQRIAFLEKQVQELSRGQICTTYCQ